MHLCLNCNLGQANCGKNKESNKQSKVTLWKVSLGAVLLKEISLGKSEGDSFSLAGYGVTSISFLEPVYGLVKKFSGQLTSFPVGPCN